MPIKFSSTASISTQFSFLPTEGSNPKKYIKIDGRMQLNPAYKRPNRGEENQLPVVSNMDEVAEYNEASMEAGYGGVPLSDSTAMTVEMMQEDDICEQVGLSSDEMVDGLGEIFCKHEVPIGLMNKLMGLSEYDVLEFLIDDSGSMQVRDSQLSDGRVCSRWEEALDRLKQMVEILAYVPTPKIEFHFMKMPDVISFTRNGERPDQFKKIINDQLDQVFRTYPVGGNPIYETFERSFQRGKGLRVARYLLCDGGADVVNDNVFRQLRDRVDPEGNPISFISCTGNDWEVEWMKEAEEIVPYSAEYDDYTSELAEVRLDQGDALPYTKGFHLIAQLVGAMNPDDLDAMDESVPFTQFTLDSLLGVKTSPEEYRHYFDRFLNAQTHRPVNTQLDRIKKNMNWNQHFDTFLTAKIARMIPAVQQFKQQLSAAKR